MVRDRQTGALDQVGTCTYATGVAISGDGRYVAYPCVSPNQPSMFGQLYIFDRTTRTEELVSAAPNGLPGNGYSGWPALSADGRYVAFLSEATDLVAGTARHQVYVRDRLTGTTELIGGVGIPTISGDGRLVAVEGLQPITGNSALFVHDRVAGTHTLAVLGGFGPSLSRDGRWLAFYRGDQVYVLSIGTNTAPVADPGPDQTVNEGSLVTLDGTGSSDPDGDPLTYRWTQDGEPVVTLSDPSSASPALLWPPNHKLVPVGIMGVSDPDNDPVTLTVTGVTQDEPVNGLGDGDTSPDALLQGSSVLLRAERSGQGNGRVYAVHFTADDGLGGTLDRVQGRPCSDSVPVLVPQSMKPGVPIIDDGQLHDSTQP